MQSIFSNSFFLHKIVLSRLIDRFAKKWEQKTNKQCNYAYFRIGFRGR
jgi:hypothetical protein